MWTRLCGRRRRERRRTNRCKNIKSPPVYRGDLIIIRPTYFWKHYICYMRSLGISIHDTNLFLHEYSSFITTWVTVPTKAAKYSLLQSSAIIIRTNIVRWYLNNYRNWAEYQSDAGSRKDTPYLALSSVLWVSLVNVCEKIDYVITAPHCITCIRPVSCLLMPSLLTSPGHQQACYWLYTADTFLSCMTLNKYW